MTDNPILELHRVGRVHRDGDSTSVAPTALGLLTMAAVRPARLLVSRRT